MKSSEKPKTPSGMRDFGPDMMAKRNFIIEKIKSVFKNYGFDNIETPAMEQLSTLTGKYGDEGDQLLFKVLNSGDYLSKTNAEDFDKGSKHLTPHISEKGLKYDLTVPFARYVVMNRHEINFPFKRYQVQPVWRADRPQRGRYREFYQCDADVVGSESLLQEVEMLLIIRDAYQSLGLNEYITKVNNRKILTGISEEIGMAGKESDFCVAIDKLDKIGVDKVLTELQKRGCPEGSFPMIQELLAVPSGEQLPYLRKFLSKSVIGLQGLDEIETIFSYLSDEEAMKVEFDLTLARGLSYYTGAIFEVKPLDSKIGSINGGGRYDDLTGVFGMEGVSGIGISFGIDRIYDVLEEKGLFPSTVSHHTKVLIATMEEAGRLHAFKMASKLRRNGISTYLYPDLSKLKKQFSYADKSNIPFVIVIGAKEIEEERYNLKNMQNGEQASLTIDGIVETLMKK